MEVFIAGSKVLSEQRKAFRSILMQMQVMWKIKVETKTFEDFDASLSEEGRQKDYNDYISNVADIVVFVFDSKVGGITMQEFDVAYESFSHYKHPEIFVFCREGDNELNNEEIEELKRKLNKLNQYYISYTDNQDLDIKFEKNINRYLIKHFVHDKTNNTDKTNNINRVKDKIKKNRFKLLFKNCSDRNSLTNIVLYTLELAGIICFILSIWDILWSLNLLTDADWTFTDIYGKGFIPGTLIIISVLYCNTKVLLWKKEGLYLLPILVMLIVIPTIWNMFEEFLIFSLIFLASYALYRVLSLFFVNIT